MVKQLKKLLIKLVKMYQSLPINTHSLCRFHPTCSQYMIESLEIHGTFKGLFLGTKRIIKCRPFGTYGYDPVPGKGDFYEKNS